MKVAKGLSPVGIRRLSLRLEQVSTVVVAEVPSSQVEEATRYVDFGTVQTRRTRLQVAAPQERARAAHVGGESQCLVRQSLDPYGLRMPRGRTPTIARSER